MNSKKAITLLVLATLLMSIVPILPVSAGMSNEQVETLDLLGPLDEEVVYGETLTVTGGDVSAKQDIEVYWDAIQPWDGTEGLLNVSKSNSDGSFEIWFDIPEAVNGDHWVWVRDVNTGETVKAVTNDADDAVIVAALIELSPSSGLEGDEVTISGYGYAAEEPIVWSWIESTTLVAPIDEALTLSPAEPETDELGSWTATFTVPDEADGYDYDDYEISARDDTGVENDPAVKHEAFTIGASVSLDVTEGPVGTEVTASGRGFEPGETITISIDPDTQNVECKALDEDELDVDADGEFVVEFFIPSVDNAEEYEIEFDDTVVDSRVDFEVTGLSGVTLDPTYALQGTTVSIEGFNFTAESGEEVEVWFDFGGFDETKVGTFETDNDGEFEGTFKLPGLTAETYEVQARQDDWNINNAEEEAKFRVGLVIVVLSVEEGPSGAFVTMTGSGFDDTDDFNVTFGGDDLIETKDVPGGGGINEDFNVPTMDPGVYTIEVLEIDSGILVTTEFEVTERTKVETNPLLAPNDYNVTVKGWYFAEDPGDNSLTFVFYNETDEWDLNVEYGAFDPVELEADADWDAGYFEGWFEVPDEDTISVGSYTLNVTDGEDMFAQYVFDVVEKTVSIDARKSVFRIGDTVAFNVESSFSQDDSYIKIWDPSGELYWKTDDFIADEWVEVGTIVRVPFYEQVAGGNPMTLLEDAPLGEWEWTWYDADDEVLDEGTFTVEQAAADVIGDQVADLGNQVTELVGQLDNVQSEFDEVKSDIADVSAVAQQAVDAANQASEAVQTVAQTANQASTAAENAADAANAAKDAANSLTTLVYGAIGAALVAALAAIVSLMQISRRIAG